MVLKTSILKVQGIDIAMTIVNENDFISLTDMIKAKDGDFFISDWLRNRNTLEYLSAWESLNNPNFNYGEFAIIKDKSGLNNFKISVREWISRTGAIGIVAKAGRYGGTYAHKDIAFNFGMWISPMFQLYIVKEYQRLKDIECNQYNLEWNVKRLLVKANYKIHTDSIDKYIIPKLPYSKKKEWIYADEADLLNIVMFGCTARQWREMNPSRSLKGENLRDVASINDLAILSNLESLNAVLLKSGLSRKERMKVLLTTVQEQKQSLEQMDMLRSVKRMGETTYIDLLRPSSTSAEDNNKKDESRRNR